MCNLRVTVCFVVAIVVGLAQAKLPPYIPACAETDPNYDTCAIASSKVAIPEIIKGDPKFYIPSLNPLEIPEVNMRPGDLQIDLKKLKISGLDDVKQLEQFHYDKEAKTVTGSILVPSFRLAADYKISGTILVLPIRGEGDFKAVLENCKIVATYPMEFIPQPDGSRRVKFLEGTIKYETTKASFSFENLFGNKALSDNMNKILNENWEAVLKDIGEAIPVTMEAVIKSICQGIFKKVTF